MEKEKKNSLPKKTLSLVNIFLSVDTLL